MKHESPVINGDGSYSRDFTYIDNVIQANEKAAMASMQLAVGSRQSESSHPEHPNTQTPEHPIAGEIFNVAYGGNTNLNELFELLRDTLAKFDEKIASIEPVYGPERPGDIPHSTASIDKARKLLGYDPQYDARQGFERACRWYWENL
jgi:UDP-N-acetylglucosamine 4-epimerase